LLVRARREDRGYVSKLLLVMPKHPKDALEGTHCVLRTRPKAEFLLYIAWYASLHFPAAIDGWRKTNITCLNHTRYCSSTLLNCRPIAITGACDLPSAGCLSISTFPSLQRKCLLIVRTSTILTAVPLSTGTLEDRSPITK